MVKHCLVSCFLLLSSLPVFSQESSQAQFPDNAAGRRASAYFGAFNSRDENDISEYLQQNYSPVALKERPVAARMVTFRQIKNDLGALEPVKVLKASDDAITVVAKAAAGQWVEVAFEFEPGPAFLLRVMRIHLLPEAPDLNAPAFPISEPEMLQELEAYLTDITKRDEFSGVALLAKGATPVFSQACGLAGKEYNAPNRIDTRFNLGSINKFFTRIAVEQLAGKGLLQLEDTIGKHLPDYPNAEAAAKVTIRHLLDMTSGIGDFFGARYQATPKDRIRTLADYLPLFADEPLLFEPGSNNRYSNGGYIVLGLVIEKVSGMSYFDYIQKHIYDVAGMSHTGHLQTDMPTVNVANGYTRLWDGENHAGEPRRNNVYSRPCCGSSAGGGYSTAEDLLKFVVTLQQGKLSAPESAQRLSRGPFAIAGGAPGINAALERDNSRDYTIIVLSNYDPPAAGRVARKIRSLLERLR